MWWRALNAATAEAMRGLETAGRLADLGVEPTYSTPQEFGNFQAKEVQRNANFLNQ